MKPEILETIQLVIQKLAPKYIFGSFEKEDIEQEAFIICVEILEKWDGSRPLENFLMVSLNNRLKNFKRNNYYRIGEDTPTNRAKKDLANKAEPYYEDLDEQDLMNKIIDADLVNMVVESLNSKMRADFYRVANNVSISKHRKDKLFEVIREIIEEY